MHVPLPDDDPPVRRTDLTLAKTARGWEPQMSLGDGSDYEPQESVMTESGQLQPEDTLDDRGVDDILDEGISPPEKLRGSTAKGVTPYEEEVGETIDERLAQEEPDTTIVPNDPIRDADRVEPGFGADYDDYPDDELTDPDDLYAGDERTGRLVAPDEGWREDDEKDMVAYDVGIDGGAASAEEAAMHEIDEDEL